MSIGTSTCSYDEAVDCRFWDHPPIKLTGEVDEAGKNALLGGAGAPLFPIAWPEPFGLVMVEAMACGTLVIAFRRSSVSEVMATGVSGFVVDDVPGAFTALGRIDRIDRAGCRAWLQDPFSTERMADGQLDLQRRLIAPSGAAAFDLAHAAYARSLPASPDNPMSYHNGSVWPHDGDEIAARIERRSGNVELVVTL